MDSQLPLLNLPPLACLWFSGADSVSFLQSQLTQTVERDPGSDPHLGQAFGYCNAQGRLLCTGWIIGPFTGSPDGPEVGLLVSADLIPRLQKRFQMFVLRAKVKIAMSAVSPTCREGDRRVKLDLGGKECLELGASSPAAIGEAPFCDWTADQVEGLANRLVAGGFPLVQESTVEVFTPQMVNLDLMGGVSFTKGCYPGQEVVARLHYLGKNRKRMLRLEHYSPVDSEAAEASVVLASPESGVLVSGALPEDWPEGMPQWAGLATLLSTGLAPIVPAPVAKERPVL